MRRSPTGSIVSARGNVFFSLKNLLAKHPYYPTIERKKKKGPDTERVTPSYNGTRPSSGQKNNQLREAR